MHINENDEVSLNSLGVPMSLAVLFFRRGFSGTWTWSTWDTRFCVFAEGNADRRETGDMSDLVDRLSLKFLDTKTTRLQPCYLFELIITVIFHM